jgi:AbrB family looped-hinge helix DNA binding protein
MIMKSRSVIARSKITARGRISVPADVRHKLGLQAGSILEWHQEGERIVVCRARCYTSEEIHRAVFPKPPESHTIKEMKAGIRRYVKARGRN